jgi:hypothetical protein
MITSAGAVEVTFRVNMFVQAEVSNFIPNFDTVEVHGSFDSWGNGITLEPAQANADVYEGTVDIAGSPGTAVDYKFVIRQNGDLQVWENDGVGPDGAQNRSFELTETPTTLPLVYFNNQSVLPGEVPVTFQVNLAIQELIGNFDPAAHTVEVHGSFDAWGPGIALTESQSEPGIYLGTVQIFGAHGDPFQYKFVINQAGTLVWEGNVGPGGPTGNRVFNLNELGQTLPADYFDNLSSDPGAGIPVTFTVSLEVRAAQGLANPTSDTVVVAGQFNNWSTTESPLTNSPADPYVYRGTYSMKSAPGSSIPYKFVLNGNTWEDGDNRVFVLADAEQTLPTDYFNRQGDLGTITLSPPSNSQITLTWTAAPAVRLQSTTSLADNWQDVPNTTGLGSVTLPISDGNVHFCLTGP